MELCSHLNKCKTKNKVSLGSWIGKQRKNYRDKKLSDVEIDLLNQIGMVWSLDDYEWNKIYKLANEYYKENGHLVVPKDYKTNEGIYLEKWIVKQRKLFGEDVLSDKEISLLNSIGMEWAPIDYKWFVKYNLAVSYYKANGDLLVPSRYVTAEGVNLGLWIKHQRKRYQENRISEREIGLLNDLGMVWKL